MGFVDNFETLLIFRLTLLSLFWTEWKKKEGVTWSVTVGNFSRSKAEVFRKLKQV